MSWKNGSRKRLILLFISFFVLATQLHAELGRVLHRNEKETVAPEEDAQNQRIHQNWNLVCWYEPELLLSELAKAGQKRELKGWTSSVEELIQNLSQTFPQTSVLPTRLRPLRNLRLRRNAEASSEIQNTLIQWDFQNEEISARRRNLLSRLMQKVNEARAFQANLTDINSQMLLTRASYTLQRRLILWSYCDSLLRMRPPEEKHIPESMWYSTLAAVEKAASEHPYSETWRKYLRLDALEHFAELTPSQQREVAWQILGRLHPDGANSSQQQFLNQTAFRDLENVLTYFASLRTCDDNLQKAAEDYELLGDLEAGNRLVLESRRLEMELGGQITATQKALETVYRNANLRLYVTREFLNSSLPQPGTEERTIQENMLNRPVYGRGVSTTSVKVQMVPDEHQFRVGFLVEGTMKSSTYSPDVVTVYNQSDAHYTALKEILFSSEGLQTTPAVAQVQNQIQLQNLHTPLDSIPVLGFVANGVARNQAEAKQESVRQISEQKIRKEVCDTLDSEVEERLKPVNQFLNEKFFTALARFELSLNQIDAKTTEEDAVIRMRLAGNVQPGASTPRPVPPASSLINFQVHESAFNNFLQQLHLEGKTFTFEELAQYLRKRMPNLKIGENFQQPPEEVLLTFADENAVTIKMENGEIQIRVAIKELRVGKRSWKDFIVEAPYQMEGRQLAVFIKREGPVRLIGRIPVGQQVAVRGIFSKVFPKTEPTNILPEKFVQNPRFAGLIVNQFVLQDGWLGISFGPQPPEELVRY